MANHSDPVEKAKANLHIARVKKNHNQRLTSLKRAHVSNIQRIKGQAESYRMMTSNAGQRKPKVFSTARAMSQEQSAQPKFTGQNLDKIRITTVKGQYDAPLKWKGLNTVTTKKFQKPDPSNMTKALTTAAGSPDLYKHQKQVGYVKSTKDLELGEASPLVAAMRRGMARVSPSYKMASKELKDRVKKDPKTAKVFHAAMVAKKYRNMDAKTLDSVTEQGKGLYYNINKKRKEGRAMRKKGSPGAPKPSDFDRAKTTAKEETMKTFSELNKYTLAGYQQKAVGDVAMRAMDQGSGIKGKSTDANRKKLQKRMGGIAKAARKLSGGGYTGGVGPESPTGKMHNEANHLANIDSPEEVSKRKVPPSIQRAMNANKGKSKSTITKGIYKRLAKDRGVEYPRRKTNEENINEISKRTLGSYVDKAAGNLMKRAHATGMRDGYGRDPIGSVAVAKRDKEVRDVVNRRAGIKGAARRLSKEEVDQVDELNVRTLRSYKDKAMDDYEDKVDPRKGGKLTSPEAKKRMQGINRASDKIQTAKIMQRQRMGVSELNVRTLRSYKDKAAGDLEDRVRAGHTTPTDKTKKRMQGLQRADDKIQTAKIMQRQRMGVSELKTSTLKSYLGKVKDKHSDMLNPHVDDYEPHKVDQERNSGLVYKGDEIARAKAKLAKRGVNELKTPTLKRYIDKAEDSQVDAGMDKKMNTSKYRNRDLMISKAKGRISMNRQLGRAEESVQEKTTENQMKETIEQVYARQVAKQLLNMDEDMHDVDDSLPKDAKKKVMNGKDKYKGLDKANGDDDKDAVANEEVDEGVLGAVGGGIVGGMAGGPVGAALGAYAGHKMQQQKNKIKKLQKPKNEEVKVTQVPENEKHTAKMKKAAKMYKSIPASQRATGSAGKRGGDSGFKPTKMGEQNDLVELSRKTLGNYMQKAADMSMAVKKKRMDQAAADPRRSATKREDQRHTGMAKASKRLDKMERDSMKEGVDEETLDELSPKTLGSYAKKAGDDVKKRTDDLMSKDLDQVGGLRTALQKTKKVLKRKQGINRATMKQEEVDQLLDVTDIENLIVEDGHADVASARRKAALMVEDALQILMKLREMEPTDSMPSWWMNKMAVSSSMIDSARNYIVVPSMDQQPEIPEEVRLTDQEAEELAEGAIGATLGGIGGAALTGGPIGAGVGAVVGHKVEKGVRSVGRRIKQGYQAFKQKPKMEATDHKAAAKMIAKKAVSNAVKDLTSEASMMIITPMLKRKKVQQDVAAAGGLPTQSATSESVLQKYLKRD